jgi:hypothetical protein
MHDDFSFPNSNSNAYSYHNEKADGNGVGGRGDERGPRVDVLSWLTRATLDVIGLAGTFFFFFVISSSFLECVRAMYPFRDSFLAFRPTCRLARTSLIYSHTLHNS